MQTAAVADAAPAAARALAVREALDLLSAALDAASVVLTDVALIQTADLTDAAGVASRVARAGVGLRTALAAEARERSLPTTAGYASLGSWLTAADPSLPAADVGATVRALDETARPTLGPLREALTSGEVSPRDAISAARAATEILPVVAPADGIAPDGTPLTAADLDARAEHVVRSVITVCRDGLGRRHLAAWKTHLTSLYAPQRQVLLDAAVVEHRAMSTFRLRHDGMFEADLVLDPQSTAVVRAAVDALSAPAPTATHGSHPGGPGNEDRDPRTPAQRRADALVDLCAAASTDRTGPMGATTRVLVAARLDDLASLAGTGRTSDGITLSPTVIRALTCDATLTRVTVGDAPGTGSAPPADTTGAHGSDGATGAQAADQAPIVVDLPTQVGAPGGLPIGPPPSAGDDLTPPTRLGTPPAGPGGPGLLDARPRGHVLDAGREHRLATARQRAALAVRDGGCTFPGCGAPLPWPQAHHVVHWVDGGATDMDNLTLLCGQHHRFVHLHGITATVTDDTVTWHVIRTRTGWRPAHPAQEAA